MYRTPIPSILIVLSDTMRPEVSAMVKVSIEVRNGSIQFNVAIRAQSIERAVRVVRGSYPGCAVRVKFPIDPEGFFVKEPTPQTGIVEVDQADLIAA